jgi:hypothetical protein
MMSSEQLKLRRIEELCQNQVPNYFVDQVLKIIARKGTAAEIEQLCKNNILEWFAQDVYNLIEFVREK